MREFCKKFLNKKSRRSRGIETINNNKKRAKKQVGIPEKIWEEYSYKIDNTTLFESIYESIRVEGTQTALHSAFMAGFVCGWMEARQEDTWLY